MERATSFTGVRTSDESIGGAKLEKPVIGGTDRPEREMFELEDRIDESDGYPRPKG